MPAPILSAVLFAHEASELAASQLPSAIRDDFQQRFIVLGRFDQLILRVSQTMPEALLQTGIEVNARAASGCSYLGHLLQADAFNPRQWAQTHPLIGYCSLRLARRALRSAGSFEFLQSYISEALDGDSDVRWAVASSTGWEDVLVLFFGRSFNAIKRAIGKLRAIHVDNAGLNSPVDRQDGFHHLVLTSCTLPGIALDHWHKDWKADDTNQLLTQIKADEPLRWAIRVETYPGHWDAFSALIKKHSEALGLHVDIAPLFGQADLRVTPADPTHATHRGLITFLTEVMFKLEAMPATVVRTVETRLIPELEGYHEDVDASYSSTRAVLRDMETMLDDYRNHSKRALVGLGTPPHTIEALEETLSRVQGMAGDRLHGEEFSAIRALADSFVRATRQALHTSPSSDRDFELEAREMLRDISDWQMHIERCLADRFRGPYPAGDSLMVRLGSHPGAHHRFLVAMDHFAQRSYNLARTCINQRLGTQTLPDAALATFIGNSPTAYAIGHMIRRLRCGFTDVPANMVGRLRDAHVVAHETGHHLFRAFVCSCTGFDLQRLTANELHRHLVEAESHSPAQADKVTKILMDQGLIRDVKELLADLFACHLCFPGQPEVYEKAAYQTIRCYYKNSDGNDRFMRSVLTDISLRQFAVRALVKQPQQALNFYDEAASNYTATITSPGALMTPRYDRLRERTKATHMALAVITRLQRHREFEALIAGLRDCGQTTDFPGEVSPNSFLTAFRTFMSAAPPPADVENLIFLDQLWFMVLRSQSGLLS